MNNEIGRILIIGAGSTGASVAYHLAKDSKNEIIIMDKAGIGAGMTSFSTAIVRTHYSNKIVAKMASDSLNELKNFGNIGESGFVKEGMLTIANDRLKSRLEDNTKMLGELGIKEEFYSPAEASRKFPYINFGDSSLVSYEPDSGYADPVTTTNSYAKKAIELGVKYVKDEAMEIMGNGTGGTAVKTKLGNNIAFDRLILCTNVWTNYLLERSGVSSTNLLPINVSAHPVVLYRRPPLLKGPRAIISDLINRDYYKPEGDTLLSGGNLHAELDDNIVNPNTFNDNVPMDYILEYTERIVKRLPDMKDATLQGSYYGMYDNTPDEEPIIDTLEKLGFNNVICNIGLSGHGFKLAPSLGKMTADLVLGRENQDLQYFKLERFKNGQSHFRKYDGISTVA